MFYSTLTKERIKRATKLGAPTLIILALVACQDPNAQQSAVVREVERAGAGRDISSLTSEELARWFVNQPATFVQQINTECKPLRAAAPTAWHMRTAEGRVCDAVMQAVPLKSPHYGADQTAY